MNTQAHKDKSLNAQLATVEKLIQRKGDEAGKEYAWRLHEQCLESAVTYSDRQQRLALALAVLAGEKRR